MVLNHSHIIFRVRSAHFTAAKGIPAVRDTSLSPVTALGIFIVHGGHCRRGWRILGLLQSLDLLL
jgi:hypothetical protein